MQFGRYRVIKEIGKGSMGTVYQAHDPSLDMIIALKVLRPEKISRGAFVKRFLNEARALGRLDRAHIVRIYNVDEDNGSIYIAMEFVEGESLNDLMSRKQFSPEEIIECGATIAETLHYAHQQGIVHRDIKPSNVLIRKDGWLKITDFSIARIEDYVSPEETRAGEILGTPAYMSPEQIMSRAVDGRSDLFSLGIILYELSAGKKPFTGSTISSLYRAITENEPLEPEKLNASIPRNLSQTIMKCMEKNPEERFSSGMALARALRDCSDKEETLTLPSPAGPGKRSNLSYLSIAFLILAAAGALLYTFFIAPSAPKSSLTVESIPEGAQVYVNGQYEGETPIRMTLLTGKHEVRLASPDYYDWEAQIQLDDKERRTPLVVRLIPVEEIKHNAE